MSEAIEAEGPRSCTCWIWHVWKWRSEWSLWTMFDVDSIISQYMNLSTWTIRYIFSCEERWKARGLFEKRWCESICCVCVLMGFSHGDIWNGHNLFECRMLRLKTYWWWSKITFPAYFGEKVTTWQVDIHSKSSASFWHFQIILPSF